MYFLKRDLVLTSFFLRNNDNNNSSLQSVHCGKILGFENILSWNILGDELVQIENLYHSALQSLETKLD